MTIFDKLRYPISWPPQNGEIGALPPALYDAWYKKVYTYTDYRSYEEKLCVLRSMILEWDNNKEDIVDTL